MGQTLVLVEKEVLEHLEGLPVAVERLTDMVSRLSAEKNTRGNILLSAKEAGAMLGISRTSWYDVIRAEDGPKPIKLTETLKRWKASEVEAFVERRTRARDQKNSAVRR